MKIKLGEHHYFIGNLDAMRQFHVARRLLPILAAVGLNPETLSASVNQPISMEVILGPVTEIIAKMSNEDAEYVINTCLSVVSREISEGKANAVMPHPGSLMYQDINMPVMMQLVVEVVKENLGGFFGGLPGPG